MVLCRAKYFDRVCVKPIPPLHRLKYFSLVFICSVFLSGNLFSSTGAELNYSSPEGKQPDAFQEKFAIEDTVKHQRKRRSPEDSVKRLINKDATRASLLSMILPGLGQAYNRHFWKIPIIYAALGGIGYFFRAQNDSLQNYHNELLFRYAHPTFSPNSYKNLTTDQLNTEKILFKKHRDFLIIGMGIVYLINVIDANVGAHMKTFDVSDKLSLGIMPKAFYCTNSPYGLAGGISVSLNFK